MKKIFLLIFFFITISLTSNAQSIIGKWYSFDRFNQKETIVEVYKVNNKFYAKIDSILQIEDIGKVCDKCTGKNKNKLIEGMIVMEDIKKDGNEWNDGKILDPVNGKYYKCYITLEDNNKLKLRGYIGFSLFGRTQYFERVVN
ncbi:MAG: DUF2147 domain-containing protein [Bacteroidota bacterium]